MAEFSEVMRQFDRMCKANSGCFNCPLHEPDGVSDRCSIGVFVNDSECIEREVMQWAAEHPVVYPTWAMVLAGFGAPDKISFGMPVMDDQTSGCTPTDYIHWLFTNRIPPEAAEKLEIEPVEVRS